LALAEEMSQGRRIGDARWMRVLYAIEQPADVEINEVVLRPTAQNFGAPVNLRRRAIN
jgi:hypothetical protein